ncbi:MAG: GNAT family N-acetyltransferase, partial [Planctomycetales bacterium]|nr:GNAT family N-acetyltransferase [Planctomycetales bacterium]
MFTIRKAQLADVGGIADVFKTEYGEHYAYPQYYDTEALSRLVYASGSLLLAAIDDESGRVAGTASVVFSVAAQNDLVGEFGRLVVHPDFRSRGLGNKLMQARIELVKPRLHVGIVDNRTSHTFSQRVSARHGFVPVGVIPGKLLVERRETIAQYVQHFGDALSLRRNNPRVIPEASQLACIALERCGLPQDAIIDDASAPFPHDDRFELDELETEGYSSLLRIERGRIRSRDVFGPIRLHYGLFQLQSQHSNYLIARQQNRVAGGIGYIVDEVEKAVKIFELISVNDGPIRILLDSLLKKCRDELDVEYLEVDVSAYAPRMQRTLLELGFLPVSYIPANVFHEVERLDAIKMSRLLVPADFTGLQFLDVVQPIADIVVPSFVSKDVQPKIAAVLRSTSLFDGLGQEQREQLMSICTTKDFAAGTLIHNSGDSDGTMHLILCGEVDLLTPSGKTVARIGQGQCVGETVLLAASTEAVAHSLSAIASSAVETAAFSFTD